jgi:putative phage-type endonuclease
MPKLKQTSTKNLSEIDWQKLRQSFSSRGMVGGSDAGTLLGWNKWKSPINLFYQSIGMDLLPTKMNRQMAFGKMLEDTIAEMWQYWDGEENFIQNVITKNKVRKFRKVKAIIENPKYPMLFANIDGEVTHHPVMKGKGILEIKNVGKMTVDSYLDGVPPSYIAQMNHYMLVTGHKYAEICMQVDGQDMLVKTFEADPDIQEAILHKATEHQYRVTAAREMILQTGASDKEEIYGIAAQFEPPADNSEDFNAFISIKHKDRENDITIQGGQEQAQWAEEYVRINDTIKHWESHKLLYGNQLKQYMEQNGGAQIMEMPNGKITWRKQFNVRLT